MAPGRDDPAASAPASAPAPAPPLPAHPSHHGQPVYNDKHGNDAYDYGTEGHAQRTPPRFQYHPPQFYIPREHPVQKKQRRCLYMYYVLRQAAITIALILIILNINVYVSGRGPYINARTRASSPVYYALWLTVPLVRAPPLLVLPRKLADRLHPRPASSRYGASPTCWF